MSSIATSVPSLRLLVGGLEAPACTSCRGVLLAGARDYCGECRASIPDHLRVLLSLFGSPAGAA